MSYIRRFLRLGSALLLVALFMIITSIVLPEPVQVAHAQNNDADQIDLTIFGPAYVTAGSNITYQLTVKSKSNNTLSNIFVENTVPTNATYVSGGTLNGSKVEFTIDSLGAGASRTLSFIVKVANSAAVGTVIENQEMTLRVGGPYGAGFSLSGMVTKVETPGEIVAIYKSNGRSFDPKLHGYKFPNYGNDPARNSNDNLGADDLFMMFGPSVCKSGTTATDCVLSGPAQKWKESQIKSANGGHCEGMAVTSLRFFDQLSFKGLRSPSDFQASASNTSGLDFPQAKLENYIMYYFATQNFEKVYSETIGGPNDDNVVPPNDILNKLQTDFNQSPPVAYTVGIYTFHGFTNTIPILKDGHAITAYGVEKVTNDEYRILVYDNNFPRQRQYITVNKSANTWRYETASTPGQPSSVYTGTATSKNLEITPLSSRDLPAGQYFTCRFCNQTTSRASVQAPTGDQNAGTIRFEYSNEGAFLVVNDEDEATGFDFNTEDFVNEIPDAKMSFFKGGLGKDIPPTIDVPYVEADDTLYSVFISGKTITSTTNGSLTMTGEGYAMGLEDIELDPNELLEVGISPDGDFIGFISTETVSAPAMFISYDPISPDDPSVIFEVNGVILDADEQVSLELDPDNEYVYFDDTGALGQLFDITMVLIWPDGDVEEFTEKIDVPAGSTSAFIDFGVWDGLLKPPIYIDDVLQNPSLNHRLKLESSTGTYDPTPQANAPLGVYRVEATFSNVTEVTLEDVYFTVANLADGNVVLNANDGPSGMGANISVPDGLLGDNGILDVNESFTFVFEIGLASAEPSEFSLDANGVPVDWTLTDTLPAGDANNMSFAFAISTERTFFLPIITR